MLGEELIEKKFIQKSVEDTEEPNKNNEVYAFMQDAWQLIVLNDTAVYETPYTTEQFKTITEWFKSIDSQFGLNEGTVFYYYRWASRYRCARMYKPSYIFAIRFIHDDIIHNKKKIHTNMLCVSYKDNTIIKVPIEESITYALH